MKNLHFIFKNGDNIIYDEDFFIDDDEYYKFKIDEETFRIKLINDLHFIKENDESIFEITYSDNALAKYTLKEKNLIFDIDLDFFEYKIQDNKYIIKYSLISDDNVIKTIIFELS